MSELVVAVGQQAASAAIQSAASSYITGVFGEPLEGPRLETVQLQSSSEGAGLPLIYGRVRVGGQVIWATRFKESKTSRSADGKGGPKVNEYSYSASFAVAFAMGPVDGVARIWADGRPLSLEDVTWRLYRGTEDQQPDPLIEAIEGAGSPPAFRGTAYIVFEDLALDDFGNRLPNLNFEVLRAPPLQPNEVRLEHLARAVTLIPGSGEFAYATTTVTRDNGEGWDSHENLNNARGKADLQAALDDLEAHLPQCNSVMIVTSWFGDDLRAGTCTLRPGVEIEEKDTRGLSWRVNGVTRASAYLVSQDAQGRPNYGGTPSDVSIVEAITELKARGFQVGLYPFILMDTPSGNGLPDPYGGSEQAAFPWRGRITCDPAPDQAGTADKTAAARAQVEAFFGSCGVDDLKRNGDNVDYIGPEEWSFRRMVLHYARLAEVAGGVDTFIIGSELRGLTWLRDGTGVYPAVEALKTLAGDVRSILGTGASITYAADWSEYFGHQPQDGSGDVIFHLDPLWADPNIDMVGIDWYAPMSDWRDVEGHADAAWPSTYDPDYLASQIEGGEGYDWYYASSADRHAQVRTPITDGSGKPWVFRFKDLRAWWSNAHYDRPGGIEASIPTAWTPQSKPIWFVEAGCPAVDKGANQPNVFYDPKSAESTIPYFSDGARDDLIQRRMLEALLRYWEPQSGANPTSSIYGGPMIAWDAIHLWTWDARPYPDFPARSDIWSDGDNWRFGHWLNGRMGVAHLPSVVRDVARQAGLAPQRLRVENLDSVLSGYLLDRPMTARAALEPLAQAFQFDVCETARDMRVAPKAEASAVTLNGERALPHDQGGWFERTRADANHTPLEARVQYYDETRDYRVGAASARQLDAQQNRVMSLAAPLILDQDSARAIADALLTAAEAAAETCVLTLAPSQAQLELGDVVSAPELGAARWRVRGVIEGPGREVTLERIADAPALALSRAAATPGVEAQPLGPPTRPVGVILDLPLLPNETERDGPRAAALARPWPGEVVVSAGDDANDERGRLVRPGSIGVLKWDLWRGPVGRWDEGNTVRVALSSGALSSAPVEDVYAGANALLVAGANGEWEILQFRDAALVGPGEYELRGLLRGQAGTETAMADPVPAGARVFVLDGASQPMRAQSYERGEAVSWRFTPVGAVTGGASTAALVHAYEALHERPLSPVHVRARRDSAGVSFTWIRRTRLGGDDWAAADVPLGEEKERYILEVLDNGQMVWSIEATQPLALLSQAQESALFSDAPRSAFEVRVAQISAVFGPGVAQHLTVSVHS